MIRFEHRNLLSNPYLRKAIPGSRLVDFADKVKSARQELQADRKADILGFYDLPEQDTDHITDFVTSLDAKFENMVVLGIGGSALGNKALYNALKTEAGLQRKVYVYDNVDPVYLYEILDEIDLEKTLFNVITKSGSTAETMSGYMIVLDILKRKFPQDYQKRMIITTDKEKGFLRQVVSSEGFSSFVVPDNVGGRFSVLTDVGLLSSAFAGIDINALLRGAARMREISEIRDIIQNPPLLNGLLHFLYMREGKNISVMMPYSNSLYDFADWYRQLWAESLGKRHDVRGREIFAGQTPVKALGTTDQHSQIQLYTQGPNDKVITFLTVENWKHDYVIPNIHPEREELNYLGGKKLSELLNAERLATEYALCQAQRPNANLIFPEISAENLGAAIMMYEIQTVFTGKLLNINPLDQPGVEAGKIATYALMGKSGYDLQRKEIKSYQNQ
ncbi:MAG: glucose-6-phosphate isomerase [Candidatus Cloacimonadaceae bacterium]|jgi:glucose-6-phosphate isomerase|nr:glucose-6-phosphate isomerase [Candidatus Cloacimonadota bacterium]MDY0128204.1 glucose-6-phosphate isomerase [Candidatus Cloacimonadaceae bacterium]MCB5254553.1 glucose-6-phosphate isomerase [Candidatus Cloacimonadota bacterium]MCK9178636.1 glucose-6-phosphate isomerase [Candidatus Cloacimonadota bacterium]MCK9242976.1 glucose-6-phosphate isomerase [Candidatus Cloacimonadota bacterium]